MTISDFSMIDTWVFDLDNTLYPAEINLFAQVDQRIGQFIAHHLNLTWDDARALQREYYADYGTTLMGLMHVHGIAPEEFLEFVHDIDVSALIPSPELDRLLASLSGRKLVFTNGSEAHAQNVIRAMDLEHHFDEIFDSAAAGYKPKHEASAFDDFVAYYAINPARTIMIDDIAHNLKLAHGLGLTTVWIQTVRDWGVPRPDSTDRHERYPHADYQAPDLVSFLRQIRP